MPYIFLDESGDLGFNFKKKKTSKFFIITCLFINDQNKKPIEKILKTIYSNLNKKRKIRTGNLHCVKEKPSTRQKLLLKLKDKEFSIMSICLNKQKVHTKLKDEKPVLYNYVTNILLDRIYSKKIIPYNKTIYLIASKRETNRFLNDNFKDYIKRQVENKHRARIEIIIKSPSAEKILQIVDFVSWAIFRKQEYGEAHYYNIIKEKITEENFLFP